MSVTETKEAPAEPTLLEVLEEALPIKRRVDIDGWPRPVWIWRLELSQLLELSGSQLVKEGTRGTTEWGVELLTMCLGDSGAPGAFRSAAGRSWLRRQGEAIALLMPIACEFNGLTKASEPMAAS